jgi:hypothetical protein
MTTLKVRTAIALCVVARTSMLLAAFVLTTASVRADDIVTHWNRVMLKTVAAGGTNPLVSTRVMAIVQASVFDSVNGIQHGYTQIHADIPAPQGASVLAAVIESAYTALVALYPTQKASLDAERAASLATLHLSGTAISLGKQFGKLVANDILTWRSTDGFATILPPYLGGTDIGEWRPTPPDFTPGALPQFATMTPWSIRSPDQFRPAGPPALNSDEYAVAFNEVKTMGSATNSPRTLDQTVLAIFWAGNTPAYWNRIADSVVGHRKMTLLRKARVFALLNVAMADAAIACWDTKYHFVFWRPITAISLADRDGNPATDVDHSWTPLLGVTPAHPEYISGHSTVSGSAVKVLSNIFGNNVSFLIDSERLPGVWRSFSSFSQALLEIHNARVFAGIHYRFSCVEGSAVGASVARFVLQHSMRPI